jgi:hypothetical protein
MSLTSRFSTYHDLISLEPEELGGVLLMEIDARERASGQANDVRPKGAFRPPWPGGVELRHILFEIDNQPKDSVA